MSPLKAKYMGGRRGVGGETGGCGGRVQLKELIEGKLEKEGEGCIYICITEREMD